MTEMQRKWYRMLLEKDIDAVNGASASLDGNAWLMNRCLWQEGGKDEIAQYRYATSKML
jgi:hypothetical protein